VPIPNADSLQKAIATRLRDKREALGFSMKAVAKAAGVDQRFVSRIEKAEQMPSLLSLLRICAVLKLKLEVLFQDY
jgi:transcriptional regulator with XRE-family HTH domain